MMFRTIPFAVAVALTATPVLAQETTQPAAPATADAARDALAKKEGEGDQSALLKQTLTAVDKQYSLIRRGQMSLTYDLSYSYVGEDRIVTDIANGNATLFNIENNNSHTVTNTFSADYGVLNNLTANLTLPLISRYADTAARSGMSNSLGDIGVGARWQPFEAHRDTPNLTLISSVRLPTGRSPFKIIAGSGEATGSGVGALTMGLNVNKIVDPVALFGSLNYTVSAPAKDLWQINGSRILTRVQPGGSFGFGMGFAYALSYGISTTVSFQEAISAGSKLRFADGLEAKTHMQTSGILNLGLGYRISPKTTINFSVGIGVTPDSPNMVVGMNLPLSF
ncbi:transporter [Pseudoduganella sp. FT25W]|uniref:Transporter n=1 Tax=Duganella alba TaxID=2666081 RepID=A0A6L5QKD1_9BURK|nr:transporter [Duganella alba]MRX09441.1 transporter [Duganella alba]MRX17662.1 transporter [Duganella alba]